MRVSRFVCVLLLLGVPAQARADFIGSSLFYQGTLDPDFNTTSLQQMCPTGATSTPISTTCSGTLGLAFQLGTGYFNGTAIETGSTSGLMSLGSGVSLDVWRVNQDPRRGYAERYFADATSTSTITDTINIGNTGALSTGFLQLSFLLNGTLAGLADFDTTDGFDPTETIGLGQYSFAYMSFTANGLSVNKAGASYTVDVPVVFGSDQLVSLQMMTDAGADMGISEGYRIVNDFSHTATLSDALILDANHQLLSGATLTSASGYGYGGLTSPADPAPVPEPATLSLLGAGVVVGAFKSRRSRSRSTR